MAEPALAPLRTRPQLDTDIDEVVEPGEPAHAHIVKVEPGESAAAKVLEARIYGIPVEALCGHVLGAVARPQAAADLREVQVDLRDVPGFNDDLPDTPDDVKAP